MHQIRFAPGLRPGPRWGSSRRSPRPPSRMGRGKLPPHTSPPSTPSASQISAPLAPRPRRLRRLGPGAFGACCFATPTSFSFPRAWLLFLLLLTKDKLWAESRCRCDDVDQ